MIHDEYIDFEILYAGYKLYVIKFDKSKYSATSIIQTPLATALMLAYRISEIVRITEVLSFLTGYVVPSH